jgi:predicted nucleic acid-binding protein
MLDPAVEAWALRQNLADHFISVITLTEVAIGVARMERRDPRQGQALRNWFEVAVRQGFRGRVLSVDPDVALVAADLHASEPRPERDTLIAATARVHGLGVATRNTADFARLGVRLVNPWDRD